MSQPRKALSLIVARDEKGVIGQGNGIPWHFSEDMKHFKRTTKGHAIIMGRKTYDSIGKPLPKRRNIVLSRSVTEIPGCEIFASLDAAIEAAYETDSSPFIIGGAKVYESALPKVKVMHITQVAGSYEGDTYFHFDENDWDLIVGSRLSANCLVETWVRK